ncbi:MAG: Crp/Fnr family transcriptional regulator [Opitutales bacterium]|jgi:CRP/FNR family transcriptional regulator, dissimilatory nitrate respiration regulator|nr:Crp/Fnr family transcriptional regulator [Opitutales bacterium]MBT5814047.1 Crp/Fnr family transcriptional regulator [Opitutales bacterium]
MTQSQYSKARANLLKIEAIKSTLRQCSLFAKLDEATLEAAADTCVTKRLDKGETLFHEGSPSQGFYIVQSGTICLSRLSQEGKEQVISIFKPFNCFAEATLSALENYPANAVAVESSQVILVRKDRFREIIKENPDLALTMLSSMSIHLKHLVQMIDDLKFKQIECRLANWLSCNATASADPNQAIAELPMSKKLLASQLGVTSETLSRAFARFRNENIITVEGRHITIIDIKALAKYRNK